MKRVLIVIVATGCFSEPDRPHGVGPPIVAGSILRHKAVVGDLNNDGYDDLVLFGNDTEPSTHPTLFVYFGGESLENPDLRIDVSVPSTDPSFVFYKWDVLDASISISADGKTRGIAAMVWQQSISTGDLVFPVFVPFAGRTAGTFLYGDPTSYAIGTPAPSSGGYAALVRDTRASLPAHEFVFGGRGVLLAQAHPLVAIDRPPDLIDFATDPEILNEVFVLPPTGAYEDLLLLGDLGVFRTTGDRDPSLGDENYVAKYPVGPKVDIVGAGHRYGRGRATSDGHFYMIASSQTDPDLPLIAVPPTGDPVAYHLTPTSPPDDLAIANVGGSDAIDVVSLQNGTLGVYRDIALGAPGAVTPAATIGLRDELAGYDVVAVGNFHGSDQLEIYATSDVHPESRLVCYHLNDQLDPCADE